MSYKYISIKKFGGPEVLEIQTAKQLPEPKNDEVRIKVLRTSAAFTDTLIRRGIYPDVRKKTPITPGYDLLGRVDKVGENVTAVKLGQKVAALTTIGAYAEYICLSEKEVILVPKNLDDNEALSLVLTFTTAYQMITRCAKLKSGQKILVHGAGGAVGSALLQIGQSMNLKMYGTASKSKHKFIEQLGGIPIDYNNKDFVLVLKNKEPNGIDAVFDSIGGNYYKRSLKTLHKNGTLVAFGSYNSGTKLELIKDFLKINLWSLIPWMPKAIFYSIGTWHKNYLNWFKEDLKTLFVLLDEGKIKPSIGKVMKLEEASFAHELIEKAEVKGKIILVVNKEN
jgi:NADPH:quinone reductase